MPKIEDQFGGRAAGNPKGDTFTSSMPTHSVRSRDGDQKRSTISNKRIASHARRGPAGPTGESS